MRRMPKGRLARIGWVAALLVLIPLLVGIFSVSVIVLYARTEGGRARVLRLALAEARKTVPGLDVGRVEGDYVHDLALRDVSVRDRQGRTAIHVDRLAARFELGGLLHHLVAVSELRVEGARVLARPTPEGALNLTELVAPPEAPPAAVTKSGRAWRVHVDRLVVDGASADLELPTGLRATVAELVLVAGLSLDGDRLEARVESLKVRLDEGARLALEGTASLARPAAGPFAPGAYDLALRVTDLDPSRWMDAPPAHLGLALTAHGAGVPLSPGSRAAVALDVPRSELAGFWIEPMHVAASSEDGRWQLPPTILNAAGVELTVSGHGEGRGVVADLRAALDGRLPGPRDKVPAVRGKGLVTAHAEGVAPDLLVTLDGQVTGLRAGATRLAEATVQARLQHLATVPHGHVHLRARGLALSATAPRIDRLVLDADGDAGGLRVSAAVAGAHVKGGVRAHGVVDATSADVTVDALSLDYATQRYRQTVALQHPTRVRYRAGEEVSLERAALHGVGFRFTGDAAVEGSYRLPPDRRDPLADASVTLQKASFGGLTPVDAELRATLTRRRLTAKLDASMPSAKAQVHVDADLPVVVPAAGSPRLAERGDVTLHVRSNTVRLQAIPVVAAALGRQGVTGGLASVSLDVTGELAHPDVKGSFDVREVMYRNIRGLGRDSTLKTVPGLGGVVALDTAPGGLHVAAEVFIRKAGVLKLDARTPVDVAKLMAGADLRTAPVQAKLEIPRYSLASLSEFADGLKGVSGQLTGSATVTGTFARPAGTAEVRVVDAKVDDLSFREVRLHGDATAGLVDVAVQIDEVTGGTLTGTGRLERAHGDRVRAELRAHDLDLRFARVLVPTLREISGVAQLSATVAGTLQAPAVTGTLSVEKGRLGLIGQPTFRDVRLAAALKPGRADLERLELRSGTGTLSGSGWVTLDGVKPRQAVFKAHAHHFLVAAAGSTGARLDGDLAVEAALRPDVISGQVRVPTAEVWLPKGPGGGSSRNLQKIGQHEDVKFVDQAALAAVSKEKDAQRAAATHPARIDVRVRTGAIDVRGKDLDLELMSNLQVGSVASGPRAGKPTLSGSVRIQRGRINLQGQRFDFTRGDITFDGTSDVNPQLDIQLQRQFPEAMVVIQLRGTPKKPDLRLTSDPPVYDQAQIVSLVLTGQPGGQPSSGKGFDPKAAVATAVLGKLADKIAPEIGLDVLRVESVDQKTSEGEATGDTDTRIEVGKYVSDRIYLSYAHVFGSPENANQNEAHVEYRLTRRWVVETIFGDAGVGGVDALWTRRY